MTFERDPDRLIKDWLDDGPRTFSPRLLDRTLADIHATPQRRRPWASWRISSMNLPMKTAVAAALVLAVAIGGGLLQGVPRLGFGPAASPSPSPRASPSPVASPSPTFQRSEVTFLGTTWQLIGYGADGRYVAALTAPAATIRFAGDGQLEGSTGCRAITGTYVPTEVRPIPSGSVTVPMTITLEGYDEPACGEPIDTQDRAVLDELPGVGGYTVTTDGSETLASGVTEAELDPALLAHYRAYPDLTRLILRDQSGESTLIYAPLPGDGPAPSPAPVATTASAPSSLAGDQDLAGTTWLLVGWIGDDGTYRMADLPAGAFLRLTRDGGTRRFEADTGCVTIAGDWTLGAANAANPTRRIDLTIDGRDELPPCPDALAAQASAVLDSLATAQAVTVGVQGADSLAPGITKQDLDPALWAHFAANPDVTRLILRDASGEAALIYAPVAPGAP